MSKNKKMIGMMFIFVLLIFLISCGVFFYFVFDWFGKDEFILYGVILAIIFGNICFGNYIIEYSTIKKDKKENELIHIVINVLVFTCTSIAVYGYLHSNKILIYIFGSFATISLIFDLVKCFVKIDKKSPFYIFNFIFDFILIFSSTIYLIYISENDDIKDILIPIIASVYGGIFTLTGVSLTIRNSNKSRHDDVLLQNRPLVFLSDPLKLDEDYKVINLTYYDTEKNQNYQSEKSKRIIYNFETFYLKNSDYSYCSLQGIIINEEFTDFKFGQVLDKKQLYEINLNGLILSEDKDIRNVDIVLADMLNNYYILKMNFNIKNDSHRYITFNSILNTELYKKSN